MYRVAYLASPFPPLREVLGSDGCTEDFRPVHSSPQVISSRRERSAGVISVWVKSMGPCRGRGAHLQILYWKPREASSTNSPPHASDLLRVVAAMRPWHHLYRTARLVTCLHTWLEGRRASSEVGCVGAASSTALPSDASTVVPQSRAAAAARKTSQIPLRGCLLAR